MTMDFAERMTVDGTTYSIDTFALEPYRKSLPSPPRFKPWPGCSNGYYGTWEIRECRHERILYLIAFNPQVGISLLFPNAELPLAATWFSGIIRGWHGERRRTGFPPLGIHRTRSMSRSPPARSCANGCSTYARYRTRPGKNGASRYHLSCGSSIRDRRLAS